MMSNRPVDIRTSYVVSFDRISARNKQSVIMFGYSRLLNTKTDDTEYDSKVAWRAMGMSAASNQET